MPTASNCPDFGPAVDLVSLAPKSTIPFGMDRRHGFAMVKRHLPIVGGRNAAAGLEIRELLG